MLMSGAVLLKIIDILQCILESFYRIDSICYLDFSYTFSHHRKKKINDKQQAKTTTHVYFNNQCR
jgi:hypothetical protein